MKEAQIKVFTDIINENSTIEEYSALNEAQKWLGVNDDDIKIYSIMNTPVVKTLKSGGVIHNVITIIYKSKKGYIV